MVHPSIAGQSRRRQGRDYLNSWPLHYERRVSPDQVWNKTVVYIRGSAVCTYCDDISNLLTNFAVHGRCIYVLRTDELSQSIGAHHKDFGRIHDIEHNIDAIGLAGATVIGVNSRA